MYYDRDNVMAMDRFLKPIAVLTVLLLLASFLVFSHSRGTIVLSRQRFQLESFNHEIGFCYQAPLGRTWMSSHERPSPAVLLEDGVPLGPGNAQHEDIRNIGRGIFSFWYSLLYFSASDNSDPRTNRKKYEVIWPTPIAAGAARVLYLVTFLMSLLSGFLLWRRLGRIFRQFKAERRRIPITALLGKRTVDIFRWAAAAFGVMSIAALACMLLINPERTLAKAEAFLVFFSICLVSGFMGYQLARRIFPPKIKTTPRFFVQGGALSALLLFFLFHPASGVRIETLTAHLPALLIPFGLGILAQIVVARFKRYIYSPALSGRCARIWRTRRLALVIGLCLIVALPGLLKPLASGWDISGFMDSRTYDRDAHDIATGKTPQGDGFHMPLYQYGLAAIDKVFGHFFFVQQIINVLMALLATSLLGLTAWNLFRDYRAVFLAGLIAAFTPRLHAYLVLTQIENWYIPLVCLALYAWSCYWRSPRRSHALLLGLSLGLAYCCRSQGLFLFAFLCLTPLFMKGHPPRTRFAHSLLLTAVFALTMVPWGIRNAIYEKSFSVASGQNESTMLLNDHRLPLFGQMGYANNRAASTALGREYEIKYPDASIRKKAIKKDFIRNTLGDPAWLSQAVLWRSLGLYGLIPPGRLDPKGPHPTDWANEGKSFLYYGFPSLFFIVISLAGFLFRPGRATLFLFLAVLAGVAVVILAPIRDIRIGYPLIPVHLLLGLFIFFKPRPAEEPLDWSLRAPPNSRLGKYRFVAGSLGIMVFLAFCHFTFGKSNLYRPLIEKNLNVDQNTKIDSALPSLNDYYNWAKTPAGSPPYFPAGTRIRVECELTNYMLPPKIAGRVPGLPDFAVDPRRETYYYAYPLPDSPPIENLRVGISYFGAWINREMREDDFVEIEGTILSDLKRESNGGFDYWLKAEKIVFVNKGKLD